MEKVGVRLTEKAVTQPGMREDCCRNKSLLCNSAENVEPCACKYEVQWVMGGG